MKITDVRTKLYAFDLARPIGDANDPTGRRRVAQLVVLVDTDEGLTGISVGHSVPPELVHQLGGLLEGEDPAGVKGLWQRMIDATFKDGAVGLTAQAIAHLDIALWDLKAKANAEPLWRTLGATSPRVRAYASGIDLNLSDQDLRAYYKRMAAAGMTIGKVKVGLHPDDDLRRIEIMRQALATTDQRIDLAIDSNEYWGPKQAIRRIKAIEAHYDLLWCEEPARRWDYRGLKEVSDAITAAVATGENLYTTAEFMPLVTNGAVDIVQINQKNTAGITGAMQIAGLANAFDLPITMVNCPGNTLAHLAAATPNHLAMEIVDAGVDRLITADQHLAGGQITLGDSPGTGLGFDEHKVAELAIDKLPATPDTMPPGRRRGAGLYEVPLTSKTSS